MRAITERLIGSEVSRRMTLGADELYRPIPVGGNWNKIRVGISYTFTDWGVGIFGTPAFFLGVCTRYKSYGSYEAHAVGMLNTSTNISRNAGPPTSYTFSMQPAQVRGQSEFTYGAQQVMTASSTVTQRHFCSIDIDKTNPAAVTFRIFRSTNTVSGNVDLSPLVCRDLMEQSVQSLSGFSNNVFSGTASIDEALNGPLDCANVAWSMTNPQLEIIQLMVQIFDAV